jgi:hypothetical protein
MCHKRSPALFPSRGRGSELISQFENEDLRPGPDQRRILEQVLDLAPGDLDLPSRAQLSQPATGEASGPGATVDTVDPAEGAHPVATPPAPSRKAGPAAAPEGEGSAAPDDPDWLPRLGKVDPSLEAGLVAEPGFGRRVPLPLDTDRHDRDIRAIRSALAGQPRLIMISGEPFLGKKAKVKGLLRMIAEDSDAFVYDLVQDGKLIARLPIRAWSARRLHYRELVERVHDFLEQYHLAQPNTGARPSSSPSTPGTARPLDEMIERINGLFRHLPAVFIFTDVDAFGENYARNVVRDIGTIEQLIRSLLDANKRSRIIITTAESAKQNNRKMIAFPLRKPIKIDPPSVAEVRQFLRPNLRSAEPLKILYGSDATVRGDDLVSLAALVNLTGSTGLVGHVPEETLEALQKFLEAEVDRRDAARKGIYRHILDAISDRGMIHPIALVAASEDGVRPDSMLYLLDHWRAHDPTVPEFTTLEALERALKQLSDEVGSRFLRRTGITRYDVEEYDIHEVHSPTDLVWEMDPLVSISLLETLRRFDRRLAAVAHRLIARIARMRSQQKKVLMRSPTGLRASEDGPRDIQCYVNLLAGILFEEGSDLEIDGPPLRLSEPEIFSIVDEVFRPARALRFAVDCLLKEDIDHDYRLTMVFDEDALRLDLYLLLFQELGQVYAPEFEPLCLPAALPLHLDSGIFSDDELLQLMNSVALAAFHAQRFDVVNGIKELAADIEARMDEAGLPGKLARLWCSHIDAAILRGGLPDGGGHRGTLTYVRKLLRQYFPGLADCEPVAADIPTDRLDHYRTYLRLLAREAELCSLIYPDREVAARLYRRIEIIETVLASANHQHDPVVLSGRVGRRYIRFLLHDESVSGPRGATNGGRAQILAKVESLLSVNKSRLRRFSGADRVGVMLDMARLYVVQGTLDKAHEYAEKAKRRAFSGSVSHGGKLDVFHVLAFVKLELVERQMARLAPFNLDAANLLDEAAVAIRNLKSVAERLDFHPSMANAFMLDARLSLAEMGLKGSTVDPVQIEKRASLALRNIARAKEIMAGIGDVSLDSALEELASRAQSWHCRAVQGK